MISGEGKLFELIRCDSDEAWREERRKGIGGSDVAAIMGLSAYSTPYQVWLDKVQGIHDDISEKPAVMWGNILEHIIGEHYAEQHPDRSVRRVNGMMRSIQRPWAQASLDYEVRDPELGWGILEIKTAGWRREDDWSDGVPVYYQTQVAHYLSVSGRPFADVAVLIAGQDYREYRVMRDEEDIETVNRAVDEFWEMHVESGVAPDVDAPDNRYVFEAHPEQGDEYVEVSDAKTADLLNRWVAAKADLDYAKERVDELGAKLKGVIGDNKGLETRTGRLTWNRFERSSFDTKRFRSEHPDMVKVYTTKKLSDGGLRWKKREEG